MRYECVFAKAACVSSALEPSPVSKAAMTRKLQSIGRAT